MYEHTVIIMEQIENCINEDYILVTPCKNEEKNIPLLFCSVLSQLSRPKLWVIVDDGSTDQTFKIIQRIASVYDWILPLKLTKSKWDLGVHLAHVYREGFDFAIDQCSEKEIMYDYIAIVDADIILTPNYFSDLILSLKNDQNLGICSGLIGNIIGNKIVWETLRENIPTGGARIWKKKCFDETGGYLLTCSPDSVSNVKANIHSWGTKKYADIKAISTRPYASAAGQWTGFKNIGMNHYFIGYTPLYVLIKGFSMCYNKKGYAKHGVGLAYIAGYFHSKIKRGNRIDDPEIIDYYQNKKMKEIIWSKIFQKKI